MAEFNTFERQGELANLVRDYADLVHELEASLMHHHEGMGMPSVDLESCPQCNLLPEEAKELLKRAHRLGV